MVFLLYSVLIVEICLQNMNGQVLASIILNSCDLLRVDLDGVQVLVPQILQALELVIKDVRSRLQ